MTRRTIPAAVVGATALVALLAVAVAGQAGSPSPAPTSAADDDVVEVVGVEYAFVGLPSSVPVGTRLGFDNVGLEFHELALAKIADDTIESAEELVAMGDAAYREGKVELMADAVLVANPGERSDGSLALQLEGRYLAICLVPQGMVPSILTELGVTENMAPMDWPPAAQAILDNPTHAALGMVQEFTVTAVDSEPGEVPGSDAVEPAQEDESRATEG
jgi:hypothetical protein